MKSLLISIVASLAAASPSAHLLHKRCSPAYDPEYLHGYLPPAPCWQTHDPACRAYLREGTEMTLDAAHHLAVVYGVPANCEADIKEEIARTADGRKAYGWLKSIGKLTVVGDGILVISGMSDETVKAYGKLKYFEPGDWS
jgi:hypothetical protein